MLINPIFFPLRFLDFLQKRLLRKFESDIRNSSRRGIPISINTRLRKRKLRKGSMTYFKLRCLQSTFEANLMPISFRFIEIREAYQNLWKIHTQRSARNVKPVPSDHE